jgi:glycosyltransferase involved in cell wall biosynthesis
MHIAFYAPMKPPDHPLPSGDRRMARAFMDLLASLGHEVDLASRFRSYDGKGDGRRQQRLEQLGQRHAARLLRHYRRRPPDLWFTYHLYHKAPDWLGPPVSRALAIPYLVVEASLARKQAAGPWAAGYVSSLAAIAEADLVLAVTGHDVPGLTAAVLPERLRLFPPFLDATPFVAAASLRSRKPKAEPLLLAVAMMRRDVKLLSYRLLAEALLVLNDLPWRLALVGDGEARDEVAAFFKPFGARVLLLGVQSSAALAEIYAKADLYVWPACKEAYGMAMLEAQAAGVPVVAGREGGVPDIVVDGTTGLLVEPRSPSALAAAVRALLGDPTRRRAMGAAAQARVLQGHDLAAARARMMDALADIRVRACASA